MHLLDLVGQHPVPCRTNGLRTGLGGVVGRRCDLGRRLLERLQNRLDTVLLPLGVDELNLHRDGRSSSAAKKDAADFRIWFARRSSRTSRSNSAILAASADVVPGRTPSSVSACFTHVRNASGCTPSWSAIRRIAPLLDAGSRLASTARRVARSRNSSGYFRGAAMTPNPPGVRCLHQTRGGTVPDHDSLHERFLSQRVRAGSALAERIRTRVVQGAGRCTRGPNDSALVVVYGAALTKYLVRPETLAPLSRDLQGEINFGLLNSRDDTTVAEVLDNVTVFLDHGEQWREGGEPLLAEMRREAVQAIPPGNAALAAAIADEIEASALAGQGRWADASRHAQAAAHQLSYGQEDTHGYRAFWLYLAGIWAHRAGRDGDPGQLSTARGLVRRAEQTSKPAIWVRQMPQLPDTEAATLPTHDDIAVAAVAAKLSGGISRSKHDTAVAKMLDGLIQTDPSLYEPELSQLGKLLGAEAAKPQGQARCDSTWCFDNALWIALEAKSDHQTTGLVSSKDVRAAAGQLRILANDRHHDGIPPGSITVMISPKPAVDLTAAASVSVDDNLFLVHPETILGLARDTEMAWNDMLPDATGRTTAELQAMVVAVLHRHGILPSHIRERLTDHRISS